MFFFSYHALFGCSIDTKDVLFHLEFELLWAHPCWFILLHMLALFMTSLIQAARHTHTHTHTHWQHPQVCFCDLKYWFLANWEIKWKIAECQVFLFKNKIKSTPVKRAHYASSLWFPFNVHFSLFSMWQPASFIHVTTLGAHWQPASFMPVTSQLHSYM